VNRLISQNYCSADDIDAIPLKITGRQILHIPEWSLPSSLPLLTMSLQFPSNDVITIHNFSYQLIVGNDAWSRAGIPQPIVISFRISHNLETAGADDDVETTLDYDKLYQHITSTLTTSRKDFNDLQDLAFTILTCHPAAEPEHSHDPLSKLPYTLIIKLPKAVLRAENGLTYTQTRELASDRAGTTPIYFLSQSLEIKDIQCLCIIGMNKYERSTPQPVILNMQFLCHEYLPDKPESSDVVKALRCYQDMARIITEVRLLVVLISIIFLSFSFPPFFILIDLCWNLKTDVAYGVL
jgi:FolB domain-containing protein